MAAFVDSISDVWMTFEGVVSTAVGTAVKALPISPESLEYYTQFFYGDIHELSANKAGMRPETMVSLIAFYFIGIVLCSLASTVFGKFKLRTFSLVHNILMVLLAVYMALEGARQWYLNDMSLFHNGIGDTPAAQGMANIVWVFTVSKPIEFIDTFIMCLKGNYRQLSFLHVYHHCSIWAIWWWLCRFHPGGELYFSLIQNSAVHAVMYSYYALRCIFPGRKFPWKSKITSFQLIQFCNNIIQAVYDLAIPGCAYAAGPIKLQVFYMISLIILFMNFYIKNYNKKKAAKKSSKSKKSQ